MHPSSYEAARDFAERYLADRRGSALRILDVGSQDINGTYRPLFEHKSWEYTGCDVAPGKNVDVVLGRMYRWNELRANHYDVVVCGQVFEHAEYIWKTILELRRVMKPGGLLFFAAPAVCPEHRYPVDCWRIFSDGAMALARYARLQALEAYTAWDRPDASGIVDTVLIARKPKLTLKQEAYARFKCAVSRMMR